MILRKFCFSALLLVLIVSAANAYTVVLRDGRLVEIPNQFTVTNSTLTYDIGNGMQVTIQLNTVDIAATERANGEAHGSFLMKANAPVERVSQTRLTGAERSITNRDLEKFRAARVESEKQYESQRQALGLPSMEERRREVTEIENRTLEQVRSMRAQEEAYWRTRADALRAEMSANEAQFGALRQGSFGSFPGFFPFDGFGITGVPFGRFRRFPTSPFQGFLATPITPFPTFPVDPVFSRRGRPLVFTTPGVRINTRPMRRGSHR
jgi:hypothetical protein